LGHLNYLRSHILRIHLAQIKTSNLHRDYILKQTDTDSPAQRQASYHGIRKSDVNEEGPRQTW
jgi:hypothetical protein